MKTFNQNLHTVCELLRDTSNERQIRFAAIDTIDGTQCYCASFLIIFYSQLLQKNEFNKKNADIFLGLPKGWVSIVVDWNDNLELSFAQIANKLEIYNTTGNLQ